jgi:hypothetical protein
MYDDLRATILNISQGGVQIKTWGSVSVGSGIKIVFPLKDGLLRLEGVVVYAESLPGGLFIGWGKVCRDFGRGLKATQVFRQHPQNGE